MAFFLIGPAEIGHDPLECIEIGAGFCRIFQIPETDRPHIAGINRVLILCEDLV